MLGTGTKLDPYQVTSVAEFRSMYDSTAYFKLMNDLDVNDSEWASGWTSVTLQFKEFDGDGHKIRNINYTGGGTFLRAITVASNTSVIKNIEFVNFIALNCKTIIHNSQTTNLKFLNCSFFIVADSDYLFNTASISSTISVENCSFKLSGNITTSINRLNSSGNTMTNVHIYLDNLMFPTTVDTRFINFQSATRVMVIGKAKKNEANNSWWFNACSQSFVAVDMVDSAYKPTIFSYSNPTTSCFYDKDLMGETLTAQTNVHALTTAQCKDKDYLNSIGFTVV